MRNSLAGLLHRSWPCVRTPASPLRRPPDLRAAGQPLVRATERLLARRGSPPASSPLSSPASPLGARPDRGLDLGWPSWSSSCCLLPSALVPLPLKVWPRRMTRPEQPPAASTRSSGWSTRVGLDDRLHVRGSRALVALLGVVAHLRAVGQRLEAAALDRAVMHEQILAGVIGCDEPEALVVVEPLDGSCCHLDSLRGCALRIAEGAAEATTAVTPGTALPS